MRHTLRLVCLLLSAVLACSCSSVSVVDTWRNPTLQVGRLHKVLVMSITRKENNRAVYEDILVAELGKHGVAAIPVHTLMPEGAKADSATLDQAVKKSSADSVLTVQTIKINKQTTVQPGFSGAYPGYWYPEAFPTWDLYGYYGSMSAYGPAYISTYDIATLQVNLFDTSSGKLLWAATVTSSEPENVVSVAKNLAEKVCDAFAKQGFI